MVNWDDLIEELNSIGIEVYANLTTLENNLLYARLIYDNIEESKETVDTMVLSNFEGQFTLRSTLENKQYKAIVSEYTEVIS